MNKNKATVLNHQGIPAARSLILMGVVRGFVLAKRCDIDHLLRFILYLSTLAHGAGFYGSSDADTSNKLVKF